MFFQCSVKGLSKSLVSVYSWPLFLKIALIKTKTGKSIWTIFVGLLYQLVDMGLEYVKGICYILCSFLPNTGLLSWSLFSLYWIKDKSNNGTTECFRGVLFNVGCLDEDKSKITCSNYIVLKKCNTVQYHNLFWKEYINILFNFRTGWLCSRPAYRKFCLHCSGVNGIFNFFWVGRMMRMVLVLEVVVW